MLAITTRLIITDYNGNVFEYTNVEACDSCHSFVPVPSQNLSFHWLLVEILVSCPKE
jgi:hypothetical protein